MLKVKVRTNDGLGRYWGHSGGNISFWVGADKRVATITLLVLHMLENA